MSLLQVGLGGLNNTVGDCQALIQLEKVKGMPTVTLTGPSQVAGDAAFDAGYLNPDTGELTNPCPLNVTHIEWLVYARPALGALIAGHNYSGKSFKFRWQGAGNAMVLFITAPGSSSVNNSTKTGDYTLGNNTGNIHIRITVPDPNDPPRNLELWEASNDTDKTAGKRFNAIYMNEAKDFKRARFMDWQYTNGNDGQDMIISETSHVARLTDSFWGKKLRANSPFGGRGGIPMELVKEFAVEATIDPWICIPHRASDDLITAWATYFRDNLPPWLTLLVENSNEPWNFGFQQYNYFNGLGTTLFGSGDVNRQAKAVGWQTARIGKIFNQVYGASGRSRWRGVLGAFTGNTSFTTQNVAGINAFITAQDPGKSITDYVNEIAVTGYFGDVVNSPGIAAITNANPAVCTLSDTLQVADGAEVKIFGLPGDFAALNNTYITIDVIDATHVALVGVNSSSWGTYTQPTHPSPACFMMRGDMLRVMDESNARFLAGQEPNKYAYYARRLATWCRFNSDTLPNITTVQTLRETTWPAHKTQADSLGLEMSAYEMGNHNVGATLLIGAGESHQYNEFNIHAGHTDAMAAVHKDLYESFTAAGGTIGSVFTMDGPTGVFGIWGHFRDMANYLNNPVWLVTKAYNQSLKRGKLRLSL